MSVTQIKAEVQDSPAAEVPVLDYVPGGPVASIHETMVERLTAADASAATFKPNTHWSEKLISGTSRALGPILLVAGYWTIARFAFW